MTLKLPVYLDHNATTPVDPLVLEAMLPYFSERFGNASSIDHHYGREAAETVELAREHVAKCIRAKSDEIYFTSGATEANNIALIGVMERLESKGNHLITCVTEHKAILDTAKYLQKRGKSVTFLPVDDNGMVNPDDVEQAITEKTVLISIMAANNEIGTIAPLSEIGKIANSHDILFHTDAAQAVGHIPVDVNKMHIDLLSMSAHKVYGPKGIGALYIRGVNPKSVLSPIIFGGGQERGIRSGTLNVPGIVGLGAALQIAQKKMERENQIFKKWNTLVHNSIQEKYPNVLLNGHPTHRLSHNLNICLEGIENKALINLLKNDIAISAGSACTTTTVEPSHVLRAIGRTDSQAHSSIRIGFGRFNTDEEINWAIDKIQLAIKKLIRITDRSMINK